jgi:hypothetical protein
VLEEEEGGEGVRATLRSKRHFAPSDIALSCCALWGDEGGGEGEEAGAGGGGGGGGNPLAVLSSWDNHVYGR